MIDMGPKPGILTTEFWLALTVVALCGAGAIWSESQLGQLAGYIGAALVAAGYGFVRTIAKG